MKKYVYKKYDSKYPPLFRREKMKLKKILPSDARIEHCGSSAVPGLAGKGIIDILISVKKRDLKKANKSLQKAGYNFKPKAGDKWRDFFDKIYLYNKSKRLVHIHLTFHDSHEFKRHLAFVNYLKNYPKDAKEYAKVKREASKYANGDGDKYREHKYKFVQKIEKRALKESKK
ncbi:GrpB family protein [Candidatus Pacearchaeota archaeon]|nr:GrpB family protein [Candidatus Pacearchaeota archaeon]